MSDVDPAILDQFVLAWHTDKTQEDGSRTWEVAALRDRLRQRGMERGVIDYATNLGHIMLVGPEEQ